jgi:sulfide:quinone oxidoreductase
MGTKRQLDYLIPVLLRLTSSANAVPRVVIAGGGVAGLEALIGLRTLAGDRLELELITPSQTFVQRPLIVAGMFGAAPGPSLDVAEVAKMVRGTWTEDSITGVLPGSGVVTLAGGEHRRYDILVIALGAKATDSIPGAIAFGTPRGTERFRRLLAEAQDGRLARIVFAVPDDVGWPLAIYELALLSADRLREAGADTEITLLTPEPAPLALFGGRASGAVLEALEQRGVHFRAGLHPQELAWGELRARPGNVRLQADAVVTLPLLRGPRLAGVAADEHGFIPVDAHGLARGTTDIYAAGDVTAFPIKHGGLAAQQADAVAASIAARVGAAVKPERFRPVLRGMLALEDHVRYLEGTIDGPEAGSGTASSTPLWWPATRASGRYLDPYLSGLVTIGGRSG